MAVPLKELIRGIDLSLKTLWVYLNRNTGEVHTLLPEHFDAADKLDLLPLGIDANIRKAKEILTDSAFIRLPTRMDVNEYRIMQMFVNTIANPTKEEELKRTLQSGMVDNRWDNLVLGLGLKEDWLNFRQQMLRRIAVNWCQLHDIKYDE